VAIGGVAPQLSFEEHCFPRSLHRASTLSSDCRRLQKKEKAMPLDFAEGYKALSSESEIVTAATATFSAITAIPAANRKAADWAGALGVGGMGLAVCQGYDTIHGGGVTLDVVVTLIGINPDGLLGKQIAIIKQLLEDIKD
jgi:hypothetical protein